MVSSFSGWSLFNCNIWGPEALREKKFYVLNFVYDPTRLLSQRVMLLHGWLSVTISHLPVKSNGTELIEDEILSFQYDK